MFIIIFFYFFFLRVFTWTNVSQGYVCKEFSVACLERDGVRVIKSAIMCSLKSPLWFTHGPIYVHNNNNIASNSS